MKLVAGPRLWRGSAALRLAVRSRQVACFTEFADAEFGHKSEVGGKLSMILLFEITSALSVPESPRRQSNRIYLQRGMTCLMCLVSHQRVKLFSEPPEERKLIHHWRYQMSTLGLPSFNKIWCQKVHKILKNRESFEFYKHVHREVPRHSKYGLK